MRRWTLLTDGKDRAQGSGGNGSAHRITLATWNTGLRRILRITGEDPLVMSAIGMESGNGTMGLIFASLVLNCQGVFSLVQANRPLRRESSKDSTEVRAGMCGHLFASLPHPRHYAEA